MIRKLLWKWRGSMVIVATILIALSPFLFGRYIFFHIDFLTQHLPYFYFFNQSIAQGNSILWNPDVFSGFSGFASYNHVYMTPWSLILLYFISPWKAYIGSIFFVLVLTGILMAAFMRRIGISRAGATVGALTFVFSQWAITHDLPIVNALYVLPLLFLALTLSFQGWHKWALLLGSFGVGLGLASGHWQFLLEAFIGAGVFAVYLKVQDDNDSWKNLLAYVGMMVVGLLFSLPKLIPAVVYLQNSARQGGVGHWEAVGSGYTVLDILRLLFPFDIALFGFAPEHYSYVGVLAILFFVLAFSLRRKGYIQFFSWFFIGSLLLSINRSVFYWLLHHLPIFNITRYSERWGILMFFAASVLVGFGIDMFADNFEKLRNSATIRFFRKLYAFSALLVGSIAIVATLVLYRLLNPTLNILYSLFDRYGYARTSKTFTYDYYYAYIHKNLLDILSNFDLTKPRVFFALLSLFGAYMLLRSIFRYEISAVNATRMIVYFMIANFIFIFPFMKKEATLQALSAQQPATIFLKNEKQIKIFDFLVRKGGFEQIESRWSDVQDTDFNDALARYYLSAAYSNTGIFNKLSSATLYDVVMARPMARLLAYVGSERSEWKEGKLTDLPISIEEKTSLFASRLSLLRFLGVTDITTPYEIKNDAFEKVFHDESICVYHISNSRPLYYFTSEEWLLDLSNDTSPEILQKTLETNVETVQQKFIFLKNKKNTEFEFVSSNPNAQLLVVSENNLPGWRAWIDGEEVQIHTFGTVFQALRVPAGKHEIIVRYEYWEIWRYFFKHNFGITI